MSRKYQRSAHPACRRKPLLKQGRPYHEPLRLITVIESPFDHSRRAIERAFGQGDGAQWLDPHAPVGSGNWRIHLFDSGDWQSLSAFSQTSNPTFRMRAYDEEPQFGQPEENSRSFLVESTGIRHGSCSIVPVSKGYTIINNLSGRGTSRRSMKA